MVQITQKILFKYGILIFQEFEETTNVEASILKNSNNNINKAAIIAISNAKNMKEEENVSFRKTDIIRLTGSVFFLHSLI